MTGVMSMLRHYMSLIPNMVVIARNLLMCIGVFKFELL